MSDQGINRIQPDEQIDGLNSYVDNIPEAEMIHAEARGIKVVGGTHGATDSAGTAFTDATYAAFSEAHVGKFLYIKGGADQGNYYRIQSRTSASVVVLSTAMTGSQSNVSWDMVNEPNLEDDVNRILTQIRNIVNVGTDWYADMPRGFDAANTDGSDTKNEKLSLKVIADSWYGSKTKILDVEDDNLGAGYTLAAGGLGVLAMSDMAYAKPADRRGFIIQKSVANAGTYYDEAILANIVLGKHKAMLISMDSNNQLGDEFLSAAGNLIYGLLEDGADHEPSGLGEGTSVYVKFYTNIGGTPTPYTWTANDPNKIRVMLPLRRRCRDIGEYEDRLQWKNGVLGDAEIAMDIEEIRSALGIADGDEAGDWDWTNVTNYYALASNPSTAEDAINALNSAIGDRLYSDNNVITDGETITESLDKLDQAVSGSGIKSKILERLSSDINKGVNHAVPFSVGSGYAGGSGITTYKVDTANYGRYLSIYVGGVKLVPWDGSNALTGQYKEINNTTVQFLFNVRKGQIIEYTVHDNA